MIRVLKRVHSVRLTSLIAGFGLMLCAVGSFAAEPLKGLLITGGCCHDYTNQVKIITEGLSQRANITWVVLHEGGSSRDHKVSVYLEEDWAKKYDIIVHNECFGAVTDPEFVKSLVAHHAGTPAVFIHCSLHSYRTAASADYWRELIGVTSKSHEGKRSLNVVRLDEKHPIMMGFPAEWKTPNGELYKIEKEWPGCTPLAKAYGVDTKKDHTVIWTNEYSKARVFGISLGHHNETMNTEEWLGVTSRGLLWACGKLNDDGTPAEGYAGSGVKPITIAPPTPESDPKFTTPKKP
ncbi:MAG: ThuA domain-containing protein [Planctomycetaceae bacterium]